MKLFSFTIIRTLIAVCSLFAIASCTIVKPGVGITCAIWLPTIEYPASLDDYERQTILKMCGVKDARRIWITTMDLDQDGKEDCVVTIALPEGIGARWRTQRSITYVFRGGNIGAFGLQWEKATLWFSLVTYEGLENVPNGDDETIRQFSICRRNGKWCISVRENEYGNDGGEASMRLMEFRRSSSWTKLPSEIPPASPEYP